MTLQWRKISKMFEYPWNDENRTIKISIGDLEGVDGIEVREKPIFEPGYYQQLTLYGTPKEHGFVSWWYHEPDPDIWKPVNVTDRD